MRQSTCIDLPYLLAERRNPKASLAFACQVVEPPVQRIPLSYRCMVQTAHLNTAFALQEGAHTSVCRGPHCCQSVAEKGRSVSPPDCRSWKNVLPPKRKNNFDRLSKGLFEFGLPCFVNLMSKEERACMLRSRLLLQEMVMRLTDEEDLFFLYTLHLGEDDFQR